MVWLFARGRIAWIVAIILGVVMTVIGLINNAPFLVTVGVGMGVFGIAFLVVSVVTRGRID